MLEAGACVCRSPEARRRKETRRDTSTVECSQGGLVSGTSMFAKPSPGNIAVVIKDATVLSIGVRGVWIREPTSSTVVCIGLRNAQSRKAQFGTNELRSKQTPRVHYLMHGLMQ